MTRRQPFRGPRFVPVLARLGLVLALLAVTLGIHPVPVARAATMDVDISTDTVANDGNCSLREAITAANTNTPSGPAAGECPAGSAATTDVINLPADTYILTGTGDDGNVTGDLDVLGGGDLTISGAGAGVTIINGSGTDRVLQVNAPGATVSITGVTIQNGNSLGVAGGVCNSNGTVNIAHSIIYSNTTTMSGGAVANLGGAMTIASTAIYSNTTSGSNNGGGVYNDFAGTVVITDSTIYSNTVNTDGGGIYNTGDGTVNITNSEVFANTAGDDGGGISNSGTVTITNSDVFTNTADDDGGGIYNDDAALTITGGAIYSNTARFGGGIYNNGNGTVAITDGAFFGNEATRAGGGVHNIDAGTVSIAGSTLSHNQAGDIGGGGIYNSSAVTITSSIIYSNTARLGGGVYNDDGTLVITDSTLSSNEAIRFGGGIYSWGGTAAVVNSTISDNEVGERGGGILNDAGVGMDIINSTISDNEAGRFGGGISNHGPMTITNSTISGNQVGEGGGGIYNTAPVTLTNVTVTGNTADTDGDDDGDGGGIFNDGSGTVSLKNTIIAANSDDTPTPGTIHPDIRGDITGDAYNLIGDTAGGTGTAGTGNDIVNPTPGLGVLADNGGDTQTHALLAGSPAVDAVPVVSCILSTDQRGVSRPQGPACDVGAYEAEPDLSIDKTVAPATEATYRGTVTYTVVLSNSGAGHGSGTLLTDTLPSEVDFAAWVVQPAAASVADDEITWSGTVTGGNAVIFTFVVTHIGDYGDVVANTARYSHTSSSGSDDATFTVESRYFVCLPIVTRAH